MGQLFIYQNASLIKGNGKKILCIIPDVITDLATVHEPMFISEHTTFSQMAAGFASADTLNES